MLRCARRASLARRCCGCGERVSASLALGWLSCPESEGRPVVANARWIVKHRWLPGRPPAFIIGPAVGRTRWRTMTAKCRHSVSPSRRRIAGWAGYQSILTLSHLGRKTGTTFPQNASIANRGWWSRGGSNSRPPHCERGALPAELRPRNRWWSASRSPAVAVSGARAGRGRRQVRTSVCGLASGWHLGSGAGWCQGAAVPRGRYCGGREP